MTFFLVTWLSISYSCPWGLSYSPVIVKELVCHKDQAIKFQLYSKEDLALKKMEDLGPANVATVVEINGGRANELHISWSPEIGQ